MSQSSTVELIVKVAKAVNPMRQVERQSQKTAAAIAKNREAFDALSTSAQKIQKNIEKSQGSFATGSRIQATFSARVLNTEKAMRAQIRALRQVQSTVKFNGALYQKAGAEIAKYESILRRTNATAEKSKAANAGLGAGLRTLAIGFGAARAAQATLQAGIRRDESERRLRLLTQRFGETAQAQEAAQRAADKFNLSQTEANVQLSRLIARLRPMGLSMQTIETAFAGFNTATILAGATASESAGAFLQLSQALGSGVLRGQELNSILEQAPLIAQAIAVEMGVAVGALKKLGEEGEITSDIVIKALGRVERDGADQLTEALKGPAASIKNFQNAAEDVQVALTQDIIPEMANSFRELAGIIEDLGPLFRLVGAGVGGALSLAREGISALTFEELRDPKGFAEKRIRQGKMPSPFAARALFEGTGPEGRGLAGMQDLAKLVGEVGGRDRDEVLMELMQKRLGMFEAPGRKKDKENLPTRPTPLANAQKKGIATAGAMELDADRQIQLLSEESKLAKELLESDFRRADALAKINSLEGISKERRQEVIDITKEAFDAEKGSIIGTALAKDIVAVDKLSQAQKDAIRPLEDQRRILEGKLAGNEEEVRLQLEVERIMRSVKDLNSDDVEAQLRKNSALEQQVKQAEELEALYKNVGTAIENSIVDGIMGAIDGTQTLQETVSGLLKDIGKMFLQFAVRGMLQSTGLPMFAAEGGYVSGATNAVVGEAGPEYIIPESKMRESMARYSRGARGSAVIPENGDGGTNGMGGGTAVAAPIDVRFSVERINSVDYVTADQFQRGMQQAAADGAKQGEQRALTTLRQNTSQRRRIGL